MEFAVNGGGESEHEPRKGKKNRIRVSNTKKPLIFYLKLAKRYIKQDNDVELWVIGMAIPTVVIITEILKRKGWAIKKKIIISTIVAEEDNRGRVIEKPKPKIEILLGKARKMDQCAVAATFKEGVDNQGITA